MEYERLEDRGLKVKPRLIIHGGAGNIRRENLPPGQYKAYRDSLLSIVDIYSTHPQLRNQDTN